MIIVATQTTPDAAHKAKAHSIDIVRSVLLVYDAIIASNSIAVNLDVLQF